MRVFVSLCMFFVSLSLNSGVFDEPPISEELRNIDIDQFEVVDNPIYPVVNKVPNQYQEFFREWDFDYDPMYLYAIITIESRWDADAVSGPNYNGSYDIGLAQLNSKYLDYFVEKYGDDIQEFDPSNGVHSLTLAARHLDFLVEKTDTVKDAIIAYNIGLTAFRNGQSPQSGAAYLSKVEGVVHGI